MNRYFNMISLIAIVTLLATSCSNLFPRVTPTGMPQYEYDYRQPEETGDGWKSSSLQKEGISANKISQLMKRILEGEYKNIHSILIVKNGKLVLEEYFYGYRKDKKHQLRSATKSVTSTLIGIAIDHGKIKNVDEKLSQFFPEYKSIDWSVPKNEITLKNVLTMSAGLDWNEWTYSDSDSRSSSYNMVRSNDWIEFVLKRKMVEIPGKVFNYSSGLSLVLGKIIKNNTGYGANEFAKTFLFDPLGIDDFSWKSSSTGMVYTAGGEKGLMLKPRDMAKIGLLFLNKGKWNDRQVVSSTWVAESTKPHIDAFFAGSEYGYQWWRGEKSFSDRKIEVFYAAGHGGQYIFVCPALDLVTVFTSQVHGNPLGVVRPQVIMVEHVLPAMVPLPETTILPGETNVASLAGYVGEYENDLLEINLKIMAKSGRLYCQLFMKKAEMHYRLNDRFSGRLDNVGNIELCFDRSKNYGIDKVTAKIGFGILQFNKK